MLLILIYFVFLTFLSLTIGRAIASMLGIPSAQPMDKIWLGLGTIAAIAGIWSLFLALDAYFVLALLCSTGFSLWKFGFNWKEIGNTAYLRTWNWKTKGSAFIVLMLVLAVATLSGYVLDNDSYYIQTIKWLNEYGLVPGIANWHLFLGQQSGFHILEAALNLEFLSLQLNDVGLFLTLVMTCWAILPSSIEETDYQKAFRHLLVLILPVLLLLGTAPSPDVPVILIHFYVLYRFLFAASLRQKENLIIMAFLVGLACYFKITSIFLAVFPLVLFLQRKKKWTVSFFQSAIFPLVFALLFLAKNSLASGYPLFPLAFASLDVDWLLPVEMANFYSAATEAQAYGISSNELAGLDLWQQLNSWSTQPGLEKWLNGLVAFIVLASVIGLISYFRNVKMRVTLITFLLFCVTLFYTSPQARFFLPMLFPVAIILLIYTLPYFRDRSAGMILLGLGMSFLILGVPSLVSTLTDNPRMKDLPTFSGNNLLLPGARSRFGTAFAKANINNINYYNPESTDFFYGAYDIPLPAAQPEYLEYFNTYFQVSPEYRRDSPKEGFRAIKN